MRILLPLLSGLLLAACVSPTKPDSPPILQASCETESVSVSADFPTGAMAGCSVLSDREILIAIRPEDEKINPSPWYSLKLSPKAPGEVSLVMDYAGFKHRYSPKVSRDRESWAKLPDRFLTVSKDKSTATIRVPLTDSDIYVAGQEILDNDSYRIWEEAHAQSPEISLSTIGHSIEQRPIRMLSTAPEGAKKTVMLVGRQHPPEVTGALAMRSFVDTVLADTPLANEFRSKFALMIIANMNPDGVDLGHWRHNLGGKDLNRDWGPFTQPETQAIRDLLKTDALTERPPLVFLDFHSTHRNVFYTQTVEEEPTDYDFTGNWITQSAARIPTYDFERAERHNSELPTSKNFMFGAYNIPAITYELGDETSRELIADSATVFAEEMMELLLAEAQE